MYFSCFKFARLKINTYICIIKQTISLTLKIKDYGNYNKEQHSVWSDLFYR